MSDTNILIIIPARGGSKGIPRKNLRALNGKPLIYYSIKNALGISVGNCDCYVSSDDEEIRLMARKFGAKTVDRPADKASDMVTLDPVIHHAKQEVEKMESKRYDLVITMQPTSPLLKKETLDKAIQQMLDRSDLDTLISGTYDSHLTWIREEGQFRPNYEKRVNRQELPEIYKETGGFVITRSKFVKPGSRFGNNVEVFPLGKREAIDIDDFEDWSLCEFYLKRKKVLFVVTGNQTVGMGHVYNTLSVANDILSHSVEFIVDKNSELAFQKISETNYRVFKQRSEALEDDIKKIAPDIVINDILDTSASYMNALTALGVKTINFEDLGEGAAKADLVINAMYPEGKIMSDHYFGAKYFILRDEFLFTPDKIIGPEVAHVMLSFGGVDPNDYTRRVLQLVYPLRKKYNFKITIIAGMGYKEPQNLKKEFGDIDLKTDISSMSDEILAADIVFTSAGRTTFEVASIGTPTIVLCQNPRETTHFFASEKNGFYNLGLGYEKKDEEILHAFKEVLKVEVRETMHQRMLENDLRQGKKRVMKLVKNLIEK